ncbi:MAG TPA: DUF5302 domain-containing protein [Trebonia sp.]|nr:DUF5302 domain-containing protein [Trebonia sp.]
MAKSAKTPVSPGDAAGSAEAGSPEAGSPEAGSPEAETSEGKSPDAAAPPGAEPQTAPEVADDLDETKRKFREALDRKKQAHANDSAAAGNRAAGKAQGAGGPATSRRQFRRKSG